MCSRRQHELPGQDGMAPEGSDGFLPYRPLASEVLSELGSNRDLAFLHMPFVVDGELSLDRWGPPTAPHAPLASPPAEMQTAMCSGC